MRRTFKTLSMFAFALVFLAGTAFAQDNEAIVNQVGSDIDADVTQTGNENFFQLDQSEDWITGHSATITQIGDQNYGAITTQNGGGIADVEMHGDRNQLLNFNLDAESAANQKNSLNEFGLFIEGSYNLVGMDQEFGIGDVSIDGNENSVALKQRSSANYQVEDFFTAEINVDGSYNEVRVQQGPNFGSSGIGSSAQVDLVNGSDWNTVDLKQTGEFQSATVYVDGVNNNAAITQSN